MNKAQATYLQTIIYLNTRQIQVETNHENIHKISLLHN